MMTATCDTLISHPSVSKMIPVGQIETHLSDEEIASRVRQIRCSWSISERIRRRREAEQRLGSLVDSLMGPAA